MIFCYFNYSHDDFSIVSGSNLHCCLLTRPDSSRLFFDRWLTAERNWCFKSNYVCRLGEDSRDRLSLLTSDRLTTPAKKIAAKETSTAATYTL
ncbi:hypothetical protein [Myxosarcina sp. GI1]|uniref:hypothetical protein n=1 Tax=Myxosarcina sp. GI1 TaxID=1541065 RepID=UPI000562656B|nr:hypothetical protein [Myxosarcina sp. GI1]